MFQPGRLWRPGRLGAHRGSTPFSLIEDILNLRTPTITDEVEDINGSIRRVVNDNETIAAQAKQIEIKQKFASWIWSDENRATRLARIYNDRFNAFRKREFDGSHLTFPGMSSEIALYRHQSNAIWRIMTNKATLLGHAVGAGKTFSMIAAAMELKRLGLCHKSLFVVPNHLPAQWAAEAIRLLPDNDQLALKIQIGFPEFENLALAQSGIEGDDHRQPQHPLWLDIRQTNILAPIITARFQMCKDKGFDAIEADNVDGRNLNVRATLELSDQSVAFSGSVL